VTVIGTSLFIDAQRGREPARQELDELLKRPEDLAAIAGCAARAGASAIVTSDGDFTELRGIRVEYVQPC